MGTELELIETPAGLESIVKTLENENAIAVDLEADSMFHFQEKVCLLQLATGKVNAVIDPLQVQDLSLLKPVFSAENIRKVFHGADYDVRSLYRDYRIKIHNLFDTQLACRFLGIKETGLEAVLQARFDVRLDKKFQRKDWSQRPLPKEMINYASNDVKYLLPLAEMLEKELKNRGRLSWVYEECEYLSNVRPAQNDNEPLFLHFKGAGRLGPKSLAVLEGLLQYRKKVARKKDRPLFKVLGNQSLMSLATKKPLTVRYLEKTEALSRKQVKMYGDALIDVIKRSVGQPGDALPVYPRKKAPPVHPAVPDRIKALKNWRDKKARALGIEPGLLFNKSILTTLAIHNPHDLKLLSHIRELKKWQRREFGHDIITVLKKKR